MNSKKGDTVLLERVCFNFQDMCNMRCPYCYIPFNGEQVKLETCLAIVERCASLGVKVMTFGGGDPFLANGFRNLVKRTADLGIEIHIDTNGTKLSPADYALLEETTSLLALPLDGPDRTTHKNMRLSEDHFDVAIQHLHALRNRKVKLKINTVVSALNYRTICDLGELLRSYRIDIWSLYQFWPLHDAESKQRSYGLSDDLFDVLIENIAINDYPFRIEPGPIRERHGTYLFVSHTGSVYTHDLQSISKYKVLGSIFDDSTVAVWREHNTLSIRQPARRRYDSLGDRVNQIA